VGDFMAVEDHLNLSGRNPLLWDHEAGGDRFTDMYAAYNPKLIVLLEDISRRIRLNLKKGVLAYLTGPNFETPAELKMLQILGADAVGWSMVPEVLVARRYNMDVLGISCISDISNPNSMGPVDLDALYKTGSDKVEVLSSLIKQLMVEL
jgi:purine-nucleoside phosphorylase